MKKNNRTTRVALSSLGIFGTVALVIAAPLAASAHISATPSSTAAGSYSVVTFALPHGCDGSATTSVAITIPAEIDSTRPTANYGWDLTTTTDGDRTSVVTYTAKAPLPDAVRDTFSVQVVLPENAAGKTLAFPVMQTCEVGSTNWDQVQKEGEAEPEHPAPSVTVTAEVATDDDGDVIVDDGHDHADAGAADSDSVDPLAVGLGLGGLVLGAVALVISVVALRRKPAGK